MDGLSKFKSTTYDVTALEYESYLQLFIKNCSILISKRSLLLYNIC